MILRISMIIFKKTCRKLRIADKKDVSRTISRYFTLASNRTFFQSWKVSRVINIIAASGITSVELGDSAAIDGQDGPDRQDGQGRTNAEEMALWEKSDGAPCFQGQGWPALHLKSRFSDIHIEKK